MRVPASVLAYFALAFGISWNGVMLAVGYRERALWFVAMLFGPTLAALGLTAALDGVRGLREFAQGLLRSRTDARLYLTALIAPAVLCVVLSVATLVSPEFAPRILTGGRVGAMLLAAVVVGAFAGLFEEIGWTGFATPRLLAERSWFATGLLIGVPWAIWHMLPDYLGRTMSGSLWLMHAAEWFVALTAFRVLMTWVYARSRSVLLAALMHATFTGSQVLLWPAARSPTIELIWYGAFAIALAIVATIVIIATDRFISVRATGGEAVRPLPGDWVVADPVLEVTHAITIDSPPEKVWPWLAQMGSRRGGWYSWDKIDNNGWPSAEYVHAELQRVELGDVLPAVPGAPNMFVVSAVRPPKDLVLAVPGDGAPILTWEHYLEPLSDGGSRLIVRGRMAREYKRFYRALDRLPDALALVLARLGHRIMEARHLRGIKRRAEARA